MSNSEQRRMWNLQDQKEIGKIGKSELKELARLEKIWEKIAGQQQEQIQRVYPLFT